jgi:N-acetylated-alpha-linked acidic dipeptidase
MRTRALITLLATPALAQPSFPSSAYPAAVTNNYIGYEARLQSVPSRDSLLTWHQLLASEPHIAGTPGDLRNVDRIAKAFADMGLEVQKHQFWALLARPVSASLEITSPEQVSVAVKEEMLAEDTFSAHPDQMIGWNAYSGSGDVTAGVVYANYGAKADFEKLKDIGVDCSGKIVICRYGGNFRGYKARFAQDVGASGVIIYTDPADSGYAKGITYPEGGYSNSTCIERGSINTLGYNGDPLTPGIEATENAKRLDINEIDLPKIPVQPVGWAAAEQILKRMKGNSVPTGWQGGLPLAYRLTGGDELKVRLKVQQDRKIIPTFNVIATLKGSTHPDQWMIIGCHHDAWNCGAADPLAGTIALMESAKAFSELAGKGHRPARSILFCAWGAEEFGIIGSSEWVEANRDTLIKNAIAYINLDMASMGPDFGASTTPSLRRLVTECAKTTRQPREVSKTVFESWLAKGEDSLFPGQPKFGDMGGGSDHVGFLCHAVMPCTSLGGGGSKGNSYHSTYDTLPWYWKVVGEDYEPALMTTRTTSAVASRIAHAPIIPLELSRYGPETRRHLIDLTKRGIGSGFFSKTEGEVASAFEPIAKAAEQFATRAAAIEARLREHVSRESPPNLDAINAAIIKAERAWRLEEGIPARPWFKSLLAASDEDSGYASWPLPGLRYCVERRDNERLAPQVEQYLDVFKRLNDGLNGIESALTR